MEPRVVEEVALRCATPRGTSVATRRAGRPRTCIVSSFSAALLRSSAAASEPRDEPAVPLPVQHLLAVGGEARTRSMPSRIFSTLRFSRSKRWIVPCGPRRPTRIATAGPSSTGRAIPGLAGRQRRSSRRNRQREDPLADAVEVDLHFGGSSFFSPSFGLGLLLRPCSALARLAGPCFLAWLVLLLVRRSSLRRSPGRAARGRSFARTAT